MKKKREKEVHTQIHTHTYRQEHIQQHTCANTHAHTYTHNVIYWYLWIFLYISLSISMYIYESLCERTHLQRDSHVSSLIFLFIHEQNFPRKYITMYRNSDGHMIVKILSHASLHTNKSTKIKWEKYMYIYKQSYL